jgi:hypothetical protein
LPYCITNRLQFLCGVIWYLFIFIKSKRVALAPNDSAQAARGKGLQHGTKRESRACLQRSC